MLRHFVTTYAKSIWQAGYLLSATTWLLAPYLNGLLSSRTATISDYKMPGQPYAWLFGIGDAVAGLLVTAVAVYLYNKRHSSPWLPPLVLACGLLMIIDSIAPATCRIVAEECVEYFSFSLLVHAVESVLLGAIIFGLSIWHGVYRKRLTSTLFAVFQIAYFMLWILMWGRSDHFATLTQYLYQILSALWIAWWLGGELAPGSLNVQQARNLSAVRSLIAGWAFANGVLAIILSLLHIHLLRFLGDFANLYFANDTAWLAQHGVIVGLAMLYLSRHLERGELRARQIFLVLLFVEVIKYSIVAPQPVLVGVYGLSFLVLFCLGPFYLRGSKPLSWELRLQEAATVLNGTLIALFPLVLLYLFDPRFARIVRRAFGEFYEFVVVYAKAPTGQLRSFLLAHTFTVFISGFIALVLWSLFRPSPNPHNQDTTEDDREDVRLVLARSSVSSEDFFKLWPPDKQYFWNAGRTAFIAYKVSGSVVFALADPVAPNTRERDALLQSFVRHWHQHGYVCCFFVVGSGSLPAYERHGLKSVPIGSSAVIGVSAFVDSTLRNKWWRWQTNRAKKMGYAYHYSRPPHSAGMKRAMRQVSDAWLSRPGHQEQGFALGYFDETYLEQCRLHYVTDEADRVVAFANELPVFNRLRQGTVDMMRFVPDAQHAMPFLLASIIRQAAESGSYDHFDLGFVPLAGTDGNISKIIRMLGSRRFSAAGLEQFKGKFEPDWHKNYLVYEGDIADLASIALNLEPVLKPPSQSG